MNYNISESGLIITQKDTIYHLDISPGQLADTIILVADAHHVSAVSKHFDRIEHKAQHQGFVTHTGFIGKKRISVIATGIGSANMDIVLNELDALANIDFATKTLKDHIKQLNIIRLGNSGSLQKEIPVDSQVISDFAVGIDNLLHYYRYENNAEELEILNKFEQHTFLSKRKIFPYIASSSRKLSNHFQENYFHGITVTGPGFYGPQGRALRTNIASGQLIGSLSTFNHHLQIVDLEMETAALYGLGKILNHHCLSINTIASNHIDRSVSKDIQLAMEKMIERSLAFIENI